MKKLEISEYHRSIFIQYLDEAKGYHFRVDRFMEEKQRPSLIFNTASVAIERYLLAACAIQGIMPYNHTYTSLVESAECTIEFDIALREQIISLDEKFGLCSLDDIYHSTPEMNDAINIQMICSKLLNIIEQHESKNVKL